jgi:hypothetical protein
LVMAAGGVQHHLDHPFHMTIRRGQGADIHAQAPGKGRAHLGWFEPLSSILKPHSTWIWGKASGLPVLSARR